MHYPFYLLASHILLPVVFTRLLIKSRHNTAYRSRWLERLGVYKTAPPTAPIWIHTVSVGEFNAAKPLIKALQARYPAIPILVTTTTPTGSDAVKAFDPGLLHSYLPYDVPGAVKRFLGHWRPRLSVIFETEIWPTLYRQTDTRSIPILLVNARLSEKSARGYQKLQPLITETLKRVSQIAAASNHDADQLKGLCGSLEQLAVFGNTKFDYQPPDNADSQIAQIHNSLNLGNRKSWIAASTHPEEETLILQAHQQILETIPDALLVLVPRHPERFDQVAELCEQIYPTARRSLNQPCSTQTKVYLADTMGELALFYGATDAAFVGGSLVPTGGHNLCEPAAYARAPLFGPHMHNFVEIRDLLASVDGARQIEDYQQLSQELIRLLNDPREANRRGNLALETLQQHRGATNKLLALIATTLDD
ncbi:MAG: lipid IV(A) 3-deoxy-D-manno-octulosonic acid transferase [Gammaproteobacteria bacterium]|nr:lipid IV(A) 3-deoxy-D-manno-octulosonic acid transferase [Gammaproteobacteria bacterium]